jgi:hypothetical protein
MTPRTLKMKVACSLQKSDVNNSATHCNKPEELNPPDDSNLSSEGVPRIL